MLGRFDTWPALAAGALSAALLGCGSPDSAKSEVATGCTANCDDAGASGGSTGPLPGPLDAGQAAPGPVEDEAGGGGPLDLDAGVPGKAPASEEAGAGPNEPAPPAPPGVDQANQLDLLFVIDNSQSMADKQQLFAEALPDMVGQLVSPPCVTPDGQQTVHPATVEEDCPDGSEREFRPVADIHVAVITTSLGGYGAPVDCVPTDAPGSEQKVDMAHLLGSLPRGRMAGPELGEEGFLRWVPGTDRQTFVGTFQNLVTAAGDVGCGWEASLESWYRFLVEPEPYVRLVRTNCPFGNDMRQSCIGPQTDEQGQPLIDELLLAQRRAFLRPASLLGVVVLTDENDCSFKASGQSWRLAQTRLNEFTINEAFKGAAVCQTDPNDPCCHSCGLAVPLGCPTAMNANGQSVAPGCEVSKKYDSTAAVNDDAINLRCFQQKRRFGVDYLYPVERYSRALTLPRICAKSPELDPAGCTSAELVNNPLYSDLSYPERLEKDPAATPFAVREPSLVYLAGAVGVPWQDVAEDPTSEELVYRRTDAEGEAAIRWDWLIGERHPATGIPAPQNPLMLEQIAPRSGVVPSTGEPLAPPGSAKLANSINGHEWNVIDRADLQYACIFPLAEPEACPSPEQAQEEGTRVSCECTVYGQDPALPPPASAPQNPLCQADDTTYDRTLRYGKAYPGLRQLQVLHDLGEKAIVASICPKEAVDQASAAYGYRPLVRAMLERFKDHLQ